VGKPRETGENGIGEEISEKSSKDTHKEESSG
jgi:hypothetical protein